MKNSFLSTNKLYNLFNPDLNCPTEKLKVQLITGQVHSEKTQQPVRITVESQKH